ncbi:HicA toxin of toxin-antitoxin [Desulfotomaculum arcticum]|uniref:HicA toxin of toxin-antitoxin n=1 Tax=Desulfotruncus arcticus DSM 17038 TaxID=1121424 RepID=A0A1I2N1E9_9FIRM|nr:HicA toxin of toxin-antitoxin [Desulfotomaculum arcticum] [Desulfotruncus arcticus DSM 17038]
MGKFEKLLKRFYQHPVPLDIPYQEAARLLLVIGCSMRKRSGSHRVFTYSGYSKSIVLMENENLRLYQVQDIKNLLNYIGIKAR